MTAPMLLDVETAIESEPSARRGSGRRLLLGLAALGIIAIVAGGYGWQRWQAAAAPQLRTAEIAVGDIEKSVTALGTLQPKDYVDVGAQVSGQLKTVHVNIGDVVQKDQLLAEI